MFPNSKCECFSYIYKVDIYFLYLPQHVPGLSSLTSIQFSRLISESGGPEFPSFVTKLLGSIILLSLPAVSSPQLRCYRAIYPFSVVSIHAVSDWTLSSDSRSILGNSEVCWSRATPDWTNQDPNRRHHRALRASQFPRCQRPERPEFEDYTLNDIWHALEQDLEHFPTWLQFTVTFPLSTMVELLPAFRRTWRGCQLRMDRADRLEQHVWNIHWSLL